MKTLRKLIELLADGKFHSGEELGAKLGVTRSAVWKSLQQLQNMGIELHSVKGRGYQIYHGIELLDETLLRAFLSPTATTKLTKFEIVDIVDSTNQYMLEQAKQGAPSGHVIFAEYQTAGRGRRGRSWHAPYGSNLITSIVWHFPMDPTEISGLSLAIAVAIINALKTYGISDNITLKWPNDVLWSQQKLAGALVEVIGETHGTCSAVIGVGMNLKIDKQTASNIDQPWVDIQEITQMRTSRNQLAGLLLNELILALMTFQEQKLKPFLPIWRRFDMAVGKNIVLQTHHENIHGTGQGISDRGELLLKDASGIQRKFMVGEISLRLV